MVRVYQGGTSRGPERGDAVEKTTLRLVTYNVHSCVGTDRAADYGRIAEVLTELAPDVVALQEVDVAGRPQDNQARDIAEALGMQFAFCPIEDDGRRAFGLALLSAFSLHDVRACRLPALHRRMRKRGALSGAVDTPRATVHILNTHLSVFRPERRRQVEVLRRVEWLCSAPAEEPFILCGDLNGGPLSQTYRELSVGMRDVQRVSGVSAATYPSRSPRLRLDHIFVSSHFRVLRVRVPRTAKAQLASDHLPLLTELTWDGRNPGSEFIRGPTGWPD